MSSEKLFRRLMHGLRFGKLNLVDDTGAVQRAQIDYGPKGADGSSLGLRDKTPVIQHFGHAANPPPGSDAILIAVLGDLGNAAVIGHNHQAKRLRNLGSGDSALYDGRGAYVWLQDGGLVIDAAGLNVTIRNTDTVTITADHVSVISDDINLGAAGGEAVARVGDTVAGGVITSGSAKIKAA